MDHVQVVCNGCQAKSELPAQSSNGKVQISFRASQHKARSKGDKQDCEYGAPQMQAVVAMPKPGATKMACKKRLTIKRPTCRRRCRSHRSETPLGGGSVSRSGQKPCTLSGNSTPMPYMYMSHVCG